MSSFSSIQYFAKGPFISGNVGITLTANVPALSSDFWVSPELRNNGINQLIISLFNNTSDGAGNYALKVFLVESVPNPGPNDPTNISLIPFATAFLNTAFVGGPPTNSTNSRQNIIFNGLNVVNSAPAITNQPFGVGAVCNPVDPITGAALTIVGRSLSNVSAATYFPEKFRVLFQNVGTASANLRELLIRTVK